MVNEEGLVANRLWGWEGREPSGEPQEPMHWGGAHPEAGRPSGRAAGWGEGVLEAAWLS